MKKVFSFIALFMLIAIVASARDVKKTSYRNALIFAYSQANSFGGDENIKFEIYDEKLWAENLTTKTIFIDLSQCFLVHNGSSFPMFSKKQDEKKASKKGVTTSVDEFITIAPTTGSHQNRTFICNMSSAIYGEYTTSETPSGNFTEYDKRLLELIGDLVQESQNADPKGKQCVGTVTRHLTEDESVSNIGVSIAYAFSKRSEDWTSFTISTWVSDVIFAPMYVEMPQDLKNKDKKGFGVKETAPAKIHVRASSPFIFDEDKSTLVVADWEGNFKKGTFKLKSTYISKTKNVGAAMLLSLAAGPAAAALIREDVYKRIIVFDGPDANWGKMKYFRGDLSQTRQK